MRTYTLEFVIIKEPWSVDGPPTGTPNDLFGGNSILGDFPADWQFFPNKIDIYSEGKKNRKNVALVTFITQNTVY